MISRRLTDLGSELETIESVALIPRVSSTLDLGNRVLAECIENELPVPSSMILAREQVSGRGRGDRSWHSPPNMGIYATLTFSVPREAASLLPLSIANATARFLRDTWGIAAGLKWPNDVLIHGEKIAGILLTARHHGALAYVAAGIGLNVCRLDSSVQNATSVESQLGSAVDLDEASLRFIRFFDLHFDRDAAAETILEQWQELTIHSRGDAIRCKVGDTVVSGVWAGIDESGRAVLETESGTERISAGDLIDWK